MLSHAATPDATLLLFTTLTYLAFWAGHANGSRSWWVPTAVACGLAMLTKGPIGVGLPGLVILLYFAWNRELGRLLDRRLVWAALAFLLVAGPWYGLVANETRGEWVKAFIGRENLHRFSASMDGHRGPVWYYLAVLLPMFAPWSAFILAMVWYGVKGTRRSPDASAPELSDTTRAHRLLICWAGIYLTVFSTAATKLPNYIFPLYPALAILTARFLIGWRDGAFAVPKWVMAAATGGMTIVAAGTIAGMILADATFPGLGVWAVLGLLPLAGAVGMAWALRQGERNRLVTAVAVASVAFVGLIVALPPSVVDRQKAPKELVRASGVGDPTRDLRVATFDWFPPSVTYYSGREVMVLESPEKAAEFLEVPTPGYIFVSEPAWKQWVRQPRDGPIPRRRAALRFHGKVRDPGDHERHDRRRRGGGPRAIVATCRASTRFAAGPSPRRRASSSPSP